MERIKSEWLEGFKSYRDWFESLKLNSKNDKVSDIMRDTYNSNLRNFIRFLRAGGDQEATPDSILEWVRTVKGKEVIKLLNNFSRWLQGQDVEGYEKRVPQRKGKFLNQVSADNLAHGTVRGFFTHNEVLLPKSGRKKKPRRSKAKKNDENYAIFKVGTNGKEVADYGLLRQFLSTLNIHDKTIIMSMLSSSQDSGEVLSLNIDFVINQPDVDRFYWEGERSKTGEEFRTFMSKETTLMLRRYVAQERMGTGPDEPLFVRTMGQRIPPKNLTQNCKNVAQKMGLVNGSTQHPFRPKRMRSIFRSACGIAGVEKGFVNVFMGHRTDISDSYMEKPRATLELRYQMVESYLTVFAGDSSQEIAEMKEQVIEYSARAHEYSERQDQAFDLMFSLQKENRELKDDVEQLKNVVDELSNYLEPYESFKARLEELEDHLRPVEGLAPEYPLKPNEIIALKKQAEELK